MTEPFWSALATAVRPILVLSGLAILLGSGRR
jgi:hypothetical protein